MKDARRVFSRRSILLAFAAGIVLALSCAHAPPPPPVTWKQIADQPVPPADQRISYGSDSLQFGELRLPPGPGPFPVVVVLHGGCWRAEYDVAHIGPVSAALTAQGIATWTLEYRRIGNEGGGWPGTFEDVARGTDHLRELAKQYPLDLSRVVTMGHSAGGHLALWLAARRRLPSGSAIASGDPLPVAGVVGLAAIGDLREYARDSSWCNASVPLLMGGRPEEVANRYAEGSPIELLPLGAPVRLLHGAGDKVVPLAQSREYVARASKLGDQVALEEIEGAGHFDVIAVTAPAWNAVEKAVRELLRVK
jgi:acetyl esterase/lipase